MKNFITGALISCIYYIVMASMIFGIYTGQSQFVGIAAAAFWILILFGIFISCVIGAAASALDSLVDETSLRATIQSMQRFSRKRNIIFRLWGWICLISAVALLAYSGWIFTAVCYVLASLFVRLIASVVRDKLAEIEKRSAPDWEAILKQRRYEVNFFQNR
ncbi:hypothetical protein M942_08560 [Enterobacter ludwigii]|jgi:hypothetical protein|uniref:hypothetical protein n=1 Tax=Enterobacter ludwigii TaxID=299767 RepID=UPI0003D95EF3|nr:hypothetical protein [Enterobacter ludwigii]AHE72778.1 hypothetical protein M942_08560 [Enterobacter ludwigii]